MPYVRRTKRRPSVSRRLKIAALVCLGLAVVLVMGGLFAMQQERISQAAKEAASYTPAPVVATEEATAPTPTAVFLGDSYAQGTGASASTSRWSTLVSESQGWEEVNMANGGTGYATAVDGETATDACGKDYCPTYAEMIPEVVEQEPSIVVVSGGRNDVGRNIDQESIAAFYRDLRSALPDAEIIAVSPVWDARESPAELSAIGDAVREAVTSVGGTYADISQPLTGNPEAITEDQVHPNDQGHQILADAVITELD